MGEQKSCEYCLWGDSCQFSRPCMYFTPLDFEARIAEIEVERSKARFDEEWKEYAEHWGSDSFF